jgi:hypothetical protein
MLPRTHFFKFLESILTIGIIILLVYFFVQPDPKGIKLGIFLMSFGVASSLIAAIVLFAKVEKTSLLNYLIISANFINIYLSVIVIKSNLESFHFSAWHILNAMIIFGAFFSIYMFYNVLRK